MILYDRVQQAQGDLTSFILDVFFGFQPPLKYLFFGMHPLVEILERGKWQGTLVDPEIPKVEPPIVRRHLASYIAPDSHIMELLDGYFVVPVTVEKIYNQYPGPYDIIGIMDVARSRMILEQRQISSSQPRAYIIKDDGNNEMIVRRGIERGYRNFMVEDYLVQVHE